MAPPKAFGRPRTYPFFMDDNFFVPDKTQSHQLVADLEASASPAIRTWLGSHRENLLPPDYGFHQRPSAEYNDPRVLYYVLDCLVDSAKMKYVRPGPLAHYLNQARQQFHWTPIAVGRVLAGIREAVMETYGVPTPDGEAYSDDDRYLPFAQSRDTRTRFYVVDPHGGNEGRLWMLAARQKMFALAMDQQKADGIGKSTHFFGKGKSAATTYADVSVNGWLLGIGPFRTKVAYEAQLTGDGSIEDVPMPPDAEGNFGSLPVNDGSMVRVGG